jgi:hypothetical protein
MYGNGVGIILVVMISVHRVFISIVMILEHSMIQLDHLPVSLDYYEVVHMILIIIIAEYLLEISIFSLAVQANMAFDV